MMYFFRTTRFVRRLEYRLAADGPIVGDQAKGGVEKGPFFPANRTEGCEAEAESLVLFDLICLGAAILIQDLKSELPRPAGAAEQFADNTMVPVFAFRIGWIAGAAAQTAHQHLEPPADGAEQAGGNQTVRFSIEVAGPQVRQCLKLIGSFAFCHSHGAPPLVVGFLNMTGSSSKPWRRSSSLDDAATRF